jgi:hypothetical protein
MKTVEAKNEITSLELEDWVLKILADPITKKPTSPQKFKHSNGIIDARVFLKNTYGFYDWQEGQDVYEQWESSGKGYGNQ